MESRLCEICKTAFAPNKYSPRQKICSNTECQKKRQLESMRIWRENHPEYFKYNDSKGMVWLETQRQRSKQWRQSNPDKVKSYRSSHMEEYRNYMRDYMRRYRDKKSVMEQGPAADTSPTTAPETPPQIPPV